MTAETKHRKAVEPLTRYKICPICESKTKFMLSVKGYFCTECGYDYDYKTERRSTIGSGWKKQKKQTSRKRKYMIRKTATISSKI